MPSWQNQKARDPVQLPIKLQVDAVAYQKFMCWVDFAKGEISALGLVEEIRDANGAGVTALLVTDFYLVKQVCSVDETTMDPQSVAELINDLESHGIDSSRLRCWVHSHADMTVFWSQTDEACISGLANGEWLLSFVVNKRRDAIMRLDQYHPCHMFLSDVMWEVSYPVVDGLAEACFAEFKAKVKESHIGFPFRKDEQRELIQDLRAAHDRGTLNDEEFDEELNWIGDYNDYCI